MAKDDDRSLDRAAEVFAALSSTKKEVPADPPPAPPSPPAPPVSRPRPVPADGAGPWRLAAGMILLLGAGLAVALFARDSRARADRDRATGAAAARADAALAACESRDLPGAARTLGGVVAPFAALPTAGGAGELLALLVEDLERRAAALAAEAAECRRAIRDRDGAVRALLDGDPGRAAALDEPGLAALAQSLEDLDRAAAATGEERAAALAALSSRWPLAAVAAFAAEAERAEDDRAAGRDAIAKARALLEAGKPEQAAARLLLDPEAAAVLDRVRDGAVAAAREVGEEVGRLRTASDLQAAAEAALEAGDYEASAAYVTALGKVTGVDASAAAARARAVAAERRALDRRDAGDLSGALAEAERAAGLGLPGGPDLVAGIREAIAAREAEARLARARAALASPATFAADEVEGLEVPEGLGMRIEAALRAEAERVLRNGLLAGDAGAAVEALPDDPAYRVREILAAALAVLGTEPERALALLGRLPEGERESPRALVLLAAAREATGDAEGATAAWAKLRDAAEARAPRPDPAK